MIVKSIYQRCHAPSAASRVLTRPTPFLQKLEGSSGDTPVPRYGAGAPFTPDRPARDCLVLPRSRTTSVRSVRGAVDRDVEGRLWTFPLHPTPPRIRREFWGTPQTPGMGLASPPRYGAGAAFTPGMALASPSPPTDLRGIVWHCLFDGTAVDSDVGGGGCERSPPRPTPPSKIRREFWGTPPVPRYGAGAPFTPDRPAPRSPLAVRSEGLRKTSTARRH